MIFNLLHSRDVRKIRICKAVLIGIICCIGMLTTTIAQAVPVTSSFYVNLNSDGEVIQDQSGGNGFNNGGWYEYIDPAGGLNWWNQWFFNSPDIDGSKWIEYDIYFEEMFSNARVEVAINWSSENWTDPNRPPGVSPGMPPGSPTLPEDNYIVRESIYTGPANTVIDNFRNPLWIDDFNPIWVSIDIRLLNPEEFDPLLLDGPVVVAGGTIRHEHIPPPPIPEPSTIFLFGLGLLGGARVCRRKQ